ncbi:hypothetical protein BN1095_4220001 [Clostridioides difficile]|uniref:Uncharacterized protein n=1 Tax=Clostridioides difficile TaxID=1496 RepID=A0A069APL2_CLODI|nr:hypothetical protein BN1095_4220001 [Clostridioides difficile]
MPNSANIRSRSFFQAVDVGRDDAVVLQGEFGGGQAQLVHIVGRQDFLQFADDFGTACRIADTQSGKTDFADGTHDDEVGNAARLRQEAVAVECAVGFVDDDDAV